MLNIVLRTCALLLPIFPMAIADEPREPTCLTRTFPGKYCSSPVWSLKGDALIFVGSDHLGKQHDIYSLQISTGVIVNLTQNIADDDSPTLSRDGKHIAFTSDRDGTVDIYVMNPDGTNVKQITDTDLRESNLRWSPKEDTLLFTACQATDEKRRREIPMQVESNANPEIYLVNMKGQLLNLTQNKLLDVMPSWAPDGCDITYSSFRKTNPEICIMNIQTNKVNILTSNNKDNWFPTWSPDGKKIAFSSLDNVNGWDICIMNKDGSNLKNLTNRPGMETYPAWSPDGSKLAFWRHQDNYEIVVMNADGSSMSSIALSESHLGPPIWSPDGANIAFEKSYEEKIGLYLTSIK